MMNTKLKMGLLFLVITLFVAGGWFILSTQNDKFCTGNLEECDNKNITIEGKLGMPHQHAIPRRIPEEYIYVEYLDTKYGQIVLRSKEEINCEDNIKIYGLLEKVTIKCKPETIGKCPYEGYHVFVYKWECLE